MGECLEYALEIQVSDKIHASKAEYCAIELGHLGLFKMS